MLIEERDSIPCGDGLAETVRANILSALGGVPVPPFLPPVAVAVMGPVFETYPKIARWHRNIVITEKLDVTNAQIYITPDGQVFPGSRNRWISPERDNFGFAAWVRDHAQELFTGLGPGRHYGEWWGPGVQRGYGLKAKVFSLFNFFRWATSSAYEPPMGLYDPELAAKLGKDGPPACCSVVPILYAGALKDGIVDEVLAKLREIGSVASPGFMRPEGAVIYHVAARVAFKKTLENDEKGKEE